ncbi:hypothetical protein JL722_6919 [Aureococcus anophagefferens]|nr:hypothetical protein JL722_6919 [Aureococcus anophagefferens]
MVVDGGSAGQFEALLSAQLDLSLSRAVTAARLEASSAAAAPRARRRGVVATISPSDADITARCAEILGPRDFGADGLAAMKTALSYLDAVHRSRGTAALPEAAYWLAVPPLRVFGEAADAEAVVAAVSAALARGLEPATVEASPRPDGTPFAAAGDAAAASPNAKLLEGGAGAAALALRLGIGLPRAAATPAWFEFGPGALAPLAPSLPSVLLDAALPGALDAAPLPDDAPHSLADGAAFVPSSPPHVVADVDGAALALDWVDVFPDGDTLPAVVDRVLAAPSNAKGLRDAAELIGDGADGAIKRAVAAPSPPRSGPRRALRTLPSKVAGPLGAVLAGCVRLPLPLAEKATLPHLVYSAYNALRVKHDLAVVAAAQHRDIVAAEEAIAAAKRAEARRAAAEEQRRLEAEAEAQRATRSATEAEAERAEGEARAAKREAAAATAAEALGAAFLACVAEAKARDAASARAKYDAAEADRDRVIRDAVAAVQRSTATYAPADVAALDAKAGRKAKFEAPEARSTTRPCGGGGGGGRGRAARADAARAAEAEPRGGAR